MNQKYFNNFLPDRTNEVKLMGSYHWKNSCDFQSLLTEFINCLQQNFPFFRSPQPLNYRESPKYYDPRYNEINSTFPFDYNIGHEEINFDS